MTKPTVTVLGLGEAGSRLGAAAAALPALRRGVIYMDLNTAPPEPKREVAALVAGVGARFADVALLGRVPARGLRTPAVASGAGAQAFAHLQQLSDETGHTVR